MAILVIGGTLHIGSALIAELGKRGAEVRAMRGHPGQPDFPGRVVPVEGDVTAPESMPAAPTGGRTPLPSNTLAAGKIAKRAGASVVMAASKAAAAVRSQS